MLVLDIIPYVDKLLMTDTALVIQASLIFTIATNSNIFMLMLMLMLIISTIASHAK